MAKSWFLQTARKIRLYTSETYEYFRPGWAKYLNIFNMAEKTTNGVCEEPPAKKAHIEEETESVPKKIKKRNVALLLAYNGANYYGMQVNQGFRTVESVLVNALNQAGFIPSEAVNNLYSIHFQRAARTDKGVSAAKQIVSFKIAENFDVQSINSHLPDDVRVFGIKRVTRGFNSKGQCYGRTYSYTLPTYALAPEFHTEYPKNYRIQPETIVTVNKELQNFVGTHCFHNFTSKKDGKDPSAKRYIVKFEANEPFVKGEEFITLTVRGQSFMLHQIRKMVGFVIATMKGLMPEDINLRVWNPTEKVSVPLAPGLGLVLEDVHYDKYNRKFGNDGLHELLTWDEVTDELNEFKQNFILSKIIEKELSEKVMFNWLQLIMDHKYQYNEGEIRADEKNEELCADVYTENVLEETKSVAQTKSVNA